MAYDPFEQLRLGLGAGQTMQNIGESVGGGIQAALTANKTYQDLKAKNKTDYDIKKHYYDNLRMALSDHGVDPAQVGILPPETNIDSAQYIEHNTLLAKEPLEKAGFKAVQKAFATPPGQAATETVDPELAKEQAITDTLTVPPTADTTSTGRSTPTNIPVVEEDPYARAKDALNKRKAILDNMAPGTISPDKLHELYTDLAKDELSIVKQQASDKNIAAKEKSKFERETEFKEKYKTTSEILDFQRSGGKVYKNGILQSQLSASDVMEDPSAFTMGEKPAKITNNLGGMYRPLDEADKKAWVDKLVSGTDEVGVMWSKLGNRHAEDATEIERRARELRPDLPGVTESDRNVKAYGSAIKPIVATRTFYSNLQNIREAIDALPPRSPLSAINSVLSGAGVQIGNKPITSFETLIEAVGPELGASLGSGTAAVARDARALAALHKDSPIEALKAAIDEIGKVETNRLVALAINSGQPGERWLAKEFGADVAKQLIDQERARSAKTATKAISGGTTTSTGTTKLKSAKGHEYVF